MKAHVLGADNEIIETYEAFDKDNVIKIAMASCGSMSTFVIVTKDKFDIPYFVKYYAYENMPQMLVSDIGCKWASRIVPLPEAMNLFGKEEYDIEEYSRHARVLRGFAQDCYDYAETLVNL